MKSPACYLTQKATTQQSPIAGKGTFALSKIYEGELIAVFGGCILNNADSDKLPPELANLFLPIDDDLFIGPATWETTGNGDFINHSCEPNAGMQGQISLVALRDILPHEEITFDYAMVISDPSTNLLCKCNHQNCRQYLTGNDWKNPHLQQKYEGFFSWYIQKKIDSAAILF